MEKSNYKNIVTNFSTEVVNSIKNNYSDILSSTSNQVVRVYDYELQNKNNPEIFNSSNINSLIEQTLNECINENKLDEKSIEDKLDSLNNEEINTVKNIIIRKIIDKILEYQYMSMLSNNYNSETNINLSNEKIDSISPLTFKMHPKLSGTLSKKGNTELLSRDIATKLNVDIINENNYEYVYMLMTAKLLNNDELLLSGNMNEIFENLGEDYKKKYVLNEINKTTNFEYLKTLTPLQLKEMNFTKEEIQQLATKDSQFKYLLPEIPEMKKEKEEMNDKINAQTIYNDNGTRFQLYKGKVVENDVDMLNVLERLNVLQQDYMVNDSTISLEDAYDKFQQEKIGTNMVNASSDTNNNDIDETSLTTSQKQMVTAAQIKNNENSNNIQVDFDKNVAMTEDGQHIDVNDVKDEANKMHNIASEMTNSNSPILPSELVEEMKNRNIDWESLPDTTKENFLKQYENEFATKDVNLENTKNNGKEVSNVRTKTLTFNKNTAAYVNSFIIVFIVGVLGGVIATILFNLTK